MNVRRSSQVLGAPPRRVHGMGAPPPSQDAIAPSATESSSTADLISQYLPTAAAVAAGLTSKDPEILKSQIKNNKRLRARFAKGTLPWTFYDNRVRTLEGKLRAAMKEEARDEVLRKGRAEWSLLGKIAVGAAITVGLAMTIALTRVGSAAGRYRSVEGPRGMPLLMDSRGGK